MVAESGVLVLPTWHHVHGQSALATPVLRATGAIMTDSPDVVGVITRCHSPGTAPYGNWGDRIACEILTNSKAIRNTIRKRGTYHLQSSILISERTYGTRSMKRSLDELPNVGDITSELND